MKTNTQYTWMRPPTAGHDESWPWRQAASGLVAQIRRLCGRRACQSPARATRTITLARGAVFRLTSGDGVRRLRMLRGSIWLTGTPDGRDVIVHAGEQFSLTGAGPFVIGALYDIEIVLAP